MCIVVFLLQALSATGLRALRYAREIEGIGQVVALDNDQGASPIFFPIDLLKVHHLCGYNTLYIDCG